MRCSFIFPSCHCQCQFYLSDPWRDGFLSKLFALCVVDSRGSFRPARLIVEPLSDCGNSCSCIVACSIVIERGGAFLIPAGPPSGGAVDVDPDEVALEDRSGVRQGARCSRVGRVS